MKVLVTGGTGMVGSAFLKTKRDHEIILVGSSDADLTSFSSTVRLLESTKPDSVIHLAARVGGVKSNTAYVADFYLQNTLINTNVLNACHENDIQKVVSLLSTCVYPNEAKYPLTEDQIQQGPPHSSNFGYAYSKRMLDVHSRALRQQYGRNYICAVPNNLYGPGDNFHLEDSHVIPAMIRKVWEAKMGGGQVVLWGDGSPLREFTFSEDIADILLFLLDKYDDPEPCNIGCTGEHAIRDIAKMICNNLDYEYNKIIWDTSKPMGQFRKPSDNSKLRNAGYDLKSYTALEVGLKKTCDWFVENYPNVRGI